MDKGNWCAVDTLPPEGQIVLGVGPSAEAPGIMHVEVCRYSRKMACWVTNSRNIPFGVSHWMYLPAPPDSLRAAAPAVCGTVLSG
jgi:Protein of unknown function (DUF551)